MKKTLLIAGAVVIGLPLVLVLAIALFFDANQFKPQLEAAIGDALGRKVSIGNIRTALLSGGIALEDLAIADDPAFSGAFRLFPGARSGGFGFVLSDGRQIFDQTVGERVKRDLGLTTGGGIKRHRVSGG